MHGAAIRDVYIVFEVKIYYEKYENCLKLFEGLSILLNGAQEIKNEYIGFQADAYLSTLTNIGCIFKRIWKLVRKI